MKSFYTIILAALLFCASSAGAQVSTQPGELVIDPPTIHNAGFAWYIGGDENRNCVGSVRFRRLGENSWRNGLNLLRVENRDIPDLVPGVTVNPGNLLAGSIFDLSPGTTYEVALTLSDPDGGAAQRTVQVTTRSEPQYGSGGRTLYVMPGSGGGDGGLLNPYKGIAEADSHAQPGDIFILKSGIYAPARLTKDGTATQPIVYRGQERDLAIIDGGGLASAMLTLQSSVGGDVVGRKFIMVEDLTLRNGSIGIIASNSEGIVLRHLNMQITRTSGDPIGIFMGGNSKNGYICDNALTGPETAFIRDEDSYAALISGTGHVYCYNLIKNFWDAGGIDQGGNDVQDIAIDFYNNIALNNTDDCFETDRSLRNIRVVRNICANSTNGLSAQPVFGGPIYMIQNQIYNVKNSSFKLNVGPSGVLILNNSAVSAGQALTHDESFNITYRNNLFYGAEVRYAFELSSYRVLGQDSIFDYNGWTPKRATSNYKLNGTRYNTLNLACDDPSVTSDLCSQTGNERHGSIHQRSDWIDVPEPVWSGTPLTPADWNFSLRSSVPSVDSALLMANINDDFVGAGPDRGALELGKPAPKFGPRDTINNPPKLTALLMNVVSEGQGLELNVSASDPDNEHVSLRMVAGPEGAIFADGGNLHGAFMWTPVRGQAGVHNVRFVGTDDSGESDEIQIQIEVLAHIDEAPAPAPSPVPTPHLNNTSIGKPVVQLIRKSHSTRKRKILQVSVPVSDADGILKVTGALSGKSLKFVKGDFNLYRAKLQLPLKPKSKYALSISVTDNLGNVSRSKSKSVKLQNLVANAKPIKLKWLEH